MLQKTSALSRKQHVVEGLNMNNYDAPNWARHWGPWQEAEERLTTNADGVTKEAEQGELTVKSDIDPDVWEDTAAPVNS
jgi:hypothetical protein